MAMILKKSREIYLKDAIGIFLKSNGAEKRGILYLTDKACVVHTAKVDKIECASAHYEHRLKVVNARYRREVIYESALGGHSELAYAYELAVNGRLIRQSVGYVGNIAAFGAIFLMIFGLYR